MSDPVTNVEIEDVLSSIRRLVSEDARPRRTPEVQPAERLVLSPALRVADELDEATAPLRPDAEETGVLAADSESAEPPIVLTTPATDDPSVSSPDVAEPDPVQTDMIPEASFVLEPENRTERDEGESHVDVAFGAEATLVEERDAVLLSEPTAEDGCLSVDGAPEAAAPDTKAEADQLAALRASLTDILIPEPETEETDPVHPPSDDVQAWSEDGEPTLAHGDAELADGDEALEHKIATLQSLLNQQAQGSNAASAEDLQPSSMDTFEAFEAERDAPDSTLVEPQSKEAIVPAPAKDSAELGSDPFELTDEARTDEQEPEEAHAVPSEAEVSDILDATVELSDSLGTQPDADDVVGHPPDQSAKPTNDAAAGAAFLRHATAQPLDWEDHLPGAEAEPDAGAVPPAEREPDSVPAELDEEALQALVANIVRQELQGVLGERITRNVRKLVRREIHRVLMSKDLD